MSPPIIEHAVTIRPGEPVFSCGAGPGSDCRLVCAHDCIDQHSPTCDGSTKDGGRCGVLNDLQSLEALDTYDGDLARAQWRSGPIRVQWSGDSEGYQWRFAESEPNAASDSPESARAQS